MVATNHGYNQLEAQALLSRVLDSFVTKHPRQSWDNGRMKDTFNTELEKEVKSARTAIKDGGIAAVQKELDATKIVLHKTIENVLERGKFGVMLDT